MKKNTVIILTSIVIATLTIFIIYRIVKNEKNSAISEKDNEINAIEISQTDGGEVTDDCIDEWDDYNKYIAEKIEEASNNLVKDDKHYILKDINGYIEVFCIEEDNQEYLYKKTNISTEYLTPEDSEDLKIGIEVVGTEALNKMLEDFE